MKRIIPITITLMLLSNTALFLALADLHKKFQTLQPLEKQVGYLLEQDELSRPFVDKDGNLRAPDGNRLTIGDGFTASTSLYIPHEEVMRMRREAKHAKEGER